VGKSFLIRKVKKCEGGGIARAEVE
jgi:hypothetical protein